MPDLLPALRAGATEAQWQAVVRNVAARYGWLSYHTHDSRRSDAGFPDLVLVHEQQQRVLFVELKTDKGAVRPAQWLWIGALHWAAKEVGLWRPRDIDEVVAVLGPRRQRLHLPAEVLAHVVKAAKR